MSLVCFPTHLQICPSNLLSAQPQQKQDSYEGRKKDRALKQGKAL